MAKCTRLKYIYLWFMYLQHTFRALEMNALSIDMKLT